MVVRSKFENGSESDVELFGRHLGSFGETSSIISSSRSGYFEETSSVISSYIPGFFMETSSISSSNNNLLGFFSGSTSAEGSGHFM